MDKDQLIKAVAEAGVVGAGGAGFPAAVKLNSSPEVIIVNGAECEPLLKVDQQLALENASELAKALNVIVTALGAKEGVFAVKEKYTQAVKAIKSEISHLKNLRVKTLGNYYPMGDEQVLVFEVLGRIVPEGGLPLACGALVINVESLLNISRAIHLKEPVIDKYLTVTGSVAKPATFKVPVGISISEVLEAAGGPTTKSPVVINGGPMMGKLEEDLTTPITKTTKGLIVLDRMHPRSEAKKRSLTSMLKIARTACCHCMYCTDLCPRYLLGHRLYPDRVMRLASYGHTGDPPDQAGQVFLCCECGLCEQACVMGLQPWRLNHELKGRLGPKVANALVKLTPDEVNRFRELRRYPIPRLVQKLGLAQYEDLKAPLTVTSFSPKRVRLMLKQHLGAPAVPIVKPGQKVKRGDKVASPPEGALGAHVHTSLTGKVEEVQTTSITVIAK
ncbi:MAG: SLBB domain-containing protein [Deltaproteobacteria bacterium]|jgi:Na+-translocating ferredoxin:NAD+ oxidoreductase RnfC subunit|nr:SLBB domain-containing protein [Deltaproteobacteria bacterium]